MQTKPTCVLCPSLVALEGRMTLFILQLSSGGFFFQLLNSCVSGGETGGSRSLPSLWSWLLSQNKAGCFQNGLLW